jgi:pyroglutamyl-peptidase
MRPGIDKEESLVVAGFEPFDGRRRNRSWEVARRVPVRPGLETLQFPVDYAGLKEAVSRLKSRRPRRLLFLGESSTKCLCVEQVALNILECDRPDNTGSKPETETIVAGGPLALRVSWNARTMAHKLNQSGIAATASFHAGTFVCNAALYLALHTLRDQVSVGFLHIPYRRWPFGMRLGLLLRAVDLCLEALRDQAPAVAADGASPRP